MQEEETVKTWLKQKMMISLFADLSNHSQSYDEKKFKHGRYLIAKMKKNSNHKELIQIYHI